MKGEAGWGRADSSPFHLAGSSPGSALLLYFSPTNPHLPFALSSCCCTVTVSSERSPGSFS